LASVLVSWSLGQHSLNSTLQQQLAVGQKAQENLTLTVQKLTQDLLKKQVEISEANVQLKKRVQDLETSSLQGMAELRSLKSTQDRLTTNSESNKENLIQQKLMIDDLQSNQTAGILVIEETKEMLQNQRNDFDTDHTRLATAETSLTNLEGVVSSLETQQADDTKNTRSALDTQEEDLEKLETRTAQTDKTLDLLKNDYSKLALASTLIGQGSPELSNLTDLVEPLQQSLTKILLDDVDNKLENLRQDVEIKQNETITAQKTALEKEVKKLKQENRDVYVSMLGYKSIPGTKGKYIFLGIRGSWYHGKQVCAEKSGRLPEFDSLEAESIVAQYSDEHYDETVFWIGTRDHEIEGHFTWETSGEELTKHYSNWNEGEPNNAGDEGEDCLEVTSNGWNDMDCGRERQIICQLDDVDF